MALTRELAEVGNMVLAPGGGWITQPDCVALLRPRSSLVYLRTRPATALRRMGSGKSRRPLLMRPDPLAELERLLESRKHAYEESDHVVDVERLMPQQVAEIIAKLVAP